MNLNQITHDAAEYKQFVRKAQNASCVNIGGDCRKSFKEMVIYQNIVLYASKTDYMK